MPELDTRFRNLSRVPAPDLWPDIERRTPRPEPVRSRAMVIGVALVLAGAGVAVVASAFLGDDPRRPRPAQTAPSPPAPVEPIVDVTLPIKFPASVVYGEGSVWVAARANDGTSTGTVYRVDPDTAEIVAEIPVSAVPTWVTGGGGMEVADGTLWVAGSGGPIGLIRIDTATNQVTGEFPVGGRFPADVAVDDYGVWVSVFVRDGDQQAMELLRVDPVTGLDEARIPLESEYAREVLAVDGAIWVHEHLTHGSVVGASILTRIDPKTEQIVASVPVGSPATLVTQGDRYIWASTWRADAGHLLARLDPHTNELTKIPSENLEFVISVGEGGIWGVARRGEDLFAERGGIVRFDPVTNHVDAGVALEGSPIAIAVAPGSVWVVHYEQGVTRIELRPA
jgi:DNA-binding beta-propeller fold protein YncE